MTHASIRLRRGLACALCAATCAAVHAADAVLTPTPPPAPTPDWAVTGNIMLVSDYIFRGISQTQHSPTFQATLDAVHKSGLYIGTFGSGVSHAAYNNGSGSEIDLYGGYRHSLGDTQSIDVGLVTYWYPRAQYVSGGETIRYHTQEAKLAYNAGTFNLTGWLSLSKNWFGFAANPADASNTRGSPYVEANWSPAISESLVLNLHGGMQRIRGLSDFNFWDAKAGVTWTLDRWILAAAVTHNSGKATKNGAPVWTFFDADGKGVNVAGTRALLSAAYSF